MPYATEADLVDEAGGLAELNELIPTTGPTGVVDVRQHYIDRALARGDAEVNSYLAPRYATPLQNPELQIVRLAAEEAVWWLWSIKGNVPAELVTKQEVRLEKLKRIRDGEIWPGDPPLAATNGQKSNVVTRDTPWSLRSLRRFF
jgi:phage gp36-like protein